MPESRFFTASIESILFIVIVRKAHGFDCVSHTNGMDWFQMHSMFESFPMQFDVIWLLSENFIHWEIVLGPLRQHTHSISISRRTKNAPEQTIEAGVCRCGCIDVVDVCMGLAHIKPNHMLSHAFGSKSIEFIIGFATLSVNCVHMNGCGRLFFALFLSPSL